VKRDGRILLSGILETQADALIAEYRRWFNIGVCESDDGWVTLAGTRRGLAHAG
jgi:ribosomal protein L11 methyltransferase